MARTLLIVRDLLTGTRRFNDLARGLPGVSRTLLTRRLRCLERAGIVDHHRTGDYLLTESGHSLLPVLWSLGEWGSRYAFDQPHPDELDADLLVWWMHSRLDTSQLPGRRHVLHLRFTDDRRQYWIVIEDGTPAVCHADPGFELTATLTTDIATLYQVWFGHTPLHAAIRTGRLDIDATRAVTRQLPTILRLSPIADLVATTRAASGRAAPRPTRTAPPQTRE